MNTVVTHTVHRLCPSPSQADTGIGYLAYLVMLYVDVFHISGTDSQTTPILVRDIREVVVCNVLMRTNFAQVCRVIRIMRLMSCRREAARYQTVARNVTEKTTLHLTAVSTVNIIQCGRTHMLERTIGKVYRVTAGNPNSSRRTSQPALIIQFVIAIVTNHLRTEFVAVCQIHTCLQRYMTFL